MLPTVGLENQNGDSKLNEFMFAFVYFFSKQTKIIHVFGTKNSMKHEYLAMFCVVENAGMR